MFSIKILWGKKKKEKRSAIKNLQRKKLQPILGGHFRYSAPY